MNTLDITTMTWSAQTQSQSVLPFYGYTATLLPNGLIVDIGLHLINIKIQIQVFDTKLYTWSTKPASGSTIASRRHHTAVLTQDGNIIIYGGSIYDSSGNIAYVFSDIAVLNTNSWVWSAPSVSGTSAPPLMPHSATLYKNYMILSFGTISTSILYKTIFIFLTYKITPGLQQTKLNKVTVIPQQIMILQIYILELALKLLRHRVHTIYETHIPTIYTPGIHPPAKYELIPMYGVPVPGNNYHSS
ncbi:galactose oxidase [Gigaspora margarita]|uniref:Galactose oxidase n=1 Tax=Gigaspora margarita TaxID=4874 RepID=A0A8H4B039_GIGMA|nr:galactose oxidase [Gigaspora margarita]